MKRLPAAALVALALLVFAAPAAGKSFGGFVTLFGTSPTEFTEFNEIVLPATVKGSISVDFHGSEAAGCAALGRCAFSGTEVFDPGSRGDLLIASARVHGKHKLIGFLALGEQRPVSTVAHTERESATGPPGICADVSTDEYDLAQLSELPVNSLSIRVGGSSVGLLGEDDFSSRCPGPLQSDLLPLLPSRRVSRKLIEHGGSIDLSTTRPFSAAGFAGTLRSTLGLRFGHPHRSHVSLADDRGGSHKLRLRDVEVLYRVEHVTGTVGVAFSGLGDPGECLALDACGASGTVSQTPAASGGYFVLSSVTPARRRRRNVRTLLGLARGGHVSGLSADGAGEWRSRAGVVSASLAWSDGGAACTDTRPLRSGVFSGGVDASRFRLEYGVSGALDSLHNHCGGPLQTDLVGVNGSLASGSVPASALRRRTVTVHLTRAPVVVPTSAYSGSVHSQITITLRREKVREQVINLSY